MPSSTWGTSFSGRLKPDAGRSRNLVSRAQVAPWRLGRFVRAAFFARYRLSGSKTKGRQGFRAGAIALWNQWRP